MPLAKNTPHDVPFALVDVRNGAALTGASVSAYRSLDGGSQSSVSGSIVEKGSGQYLFEGAAADFDASYTVGLLFTDTDAVPIHVLFQMQYFRKDNTYNIPFLLINVANSQALTGASPSGLRILDGGTQEAVSGSFVELGNGQYVFQATATDFGADDIAGFLITAANAVPLHLVIDLLESYSPTGATMDSPSSILATYLTGQAIMTVPSAGSNWPLYIRHMPDMPHNVGTIYDTAPIKDGRIQKTGGIIQHYGIEILLRSSDYEVGWSKCNDIAGQFDSVHNQVVVGSADTYTIHNISRQGGVNFLGLEQGTKGRNMFSMNFLVSMT